MKLTIVSLLISLLLPLTAAAQSETLALCDHTKGKVVIMKKGKILWEHPAPKTNDLWVLPDGNLLFTTGNGVLEVTPAKDTVFCYTAAGNVNVFACQRLENGNTFVGECQTGRMLEVDPSGNIVKETVIRPAGATDDPFLFMRNARRLANGNYLVAHYGPQRVSEYTPDGRMVWDVKVPGGPHSLFRQPNGNTMVAVADKNNDARIVELDPAGKVVWQISNKDVEGNPFKFMGGLHLSGGTIMATNWLGHGKEGTSAHLFLIDKESKQIWWKLDSHPELTAVASVFRIDKAKGKKALKALH